MPNIKIATSIAVSQIDKISADVDTFLTDTETSYDALKDTFVNSQGDFIAGLKLQLDSEKALIQESATFLKALLAMMKSAEADFETADNTYASAVGMCLTK